MKSPAGFALVMALTLPGVSSGRPIRFVLIAGQKGDAPAGRGSYGGLIRCSCHRHAAYDADHIREAAAMMGAQAVIPNTPFASDQTPARQVPLQAIPSRRMLLQRAEAVSPDRNTLRKRPHKTTLPS